jgi:glycosyltransferase involved in cell wall biosynthesis
MISIIIPTLNEEKVIEKTLSQFKDLNTLNFELIVSDGESKDKTVEIVKKYTKNILITKEKHTIAFARNQGAKIAKGEYLVFLDADVFIKNPNDFFQQALLEFEKDKKLIALTVKLKVLPEFETFWDKFFHFIINFIHWFSCNILNFGNASGEFQMIKKDVFLKIGGYNENLAVAEDAELFLRLSKIGKVKTIWKLTAYHTGRRFHQEGWLKVLYHWLLNFFSVLFFKKSAYKKWKEVR